MKARLSWIALSSLVISSSLWAQHKTQHGLYPTVTATGTGIARAKPDVVVWQVRINGVGEKLADAVEQTDQRVKETLRLAREFDIHENDRKMGPPKLHKTADPPRYEIRRTVTLRQLDLSKFDELLAKLSESESEKYTISFHFESLHLELLREEASQSAARIAQRKAIAMATALRFKVGPIESIREIGFETAKVADAETAESIEVRVTVEVKHELRWVGRPVP